MKPDRHERIFVVRMWRTDEAESAAHLRGSVRDVLAEQTLYVVGPREVADCITAMLIEHEGS